MNSKRRQYYADEIVARLKAGQVPEGLRVGIAVETIEKGEDIKRRVLEQIPDADRRWEFVIAAIGGQESEVH